MTITIPTWVLWVIGIPVGIILLFAMGIGLFLIYHGLKGNLNFFR